MHGVRQAVKRSHEATRWSLRLVIGISVIASPRSPTIMVDRNPQNRSGKRCEAAFIYFDRTPAG